MTNVWRYPNVRCASENFLQISTLEKEHKLMRIKIMKYLWNVMRWWNVCSTKRASGGGHPRIYSTLKYISEMPQPSEDDQLWNICPRRVAAIRGYNQLWNISEIQRDVTTADTEAPEQRQQGNLTTKSYYNRISFSSAPFQGKISRLRRLVNLFFS